MTRTLALVLETLAEAGVRTAWTLSTVAERPYALVEFAELERIAAAQGLDVTRQPQQPRGTRAVASLPGCDLVAFEGL